MKDKKGTSSHQPNIVKVIKGGAKWYISISVVQSSFLYIPYNLLSYNILMNNNIKDGNIYFKISLFPWPSQRDQFDFVAIVVNNTVDIYFLAFPWTFQGNFNRISSCIPKYWHPMQIYNHFEHVPLPKVQILAPVMNLNPFIAHTSSF